MNTLSPKKAAQKSNGAVDKRQRIINGALEIISSKGGEASISEIAAESGVTESAIYRNFKNKEDLLFYAAAECLRQKNDDLAVHLAGIREPSSRLSKLIWCLRLYNESKNEPYVKFDLFECRGKENYHKHEAFGYFIQFAMTTDDILRDGVQKGLFWDALNIEIARDIICGFLEMENIRYYIDPNPEAGPDEFDSIMDLVLHMVGKNQSEKKSPHKRVQIMDAAEELFFKKGYENATTLEIAKSAGVVEATLYEHFKGKEDILFTGLSHQLKQQMTRFDPAPKKLSTPDRFHAYVRTMYLSLLSRPSFAKVLITDGIYNINFYKTKAHAHFNTYMKGLDDILYQGIKEGVFRKHVKPHLVKNLFLGFFCSYTLRTLYIKSCRAEEFLGEIDDAATLLLRAVLHQPSSLP